MNVYHGVVLEGGRYVVWRNERLLPATKSQKVWNHSPTGFSWGYEGSGPAQLALAILLSEGIQQDKAVALHQKFKRAVVARLPHEVGHCWALTGAAVAEAVALLGSVEDAGNSNSEQEG